MCQLENLEARYYPAATLTATFSAGVLTVEGTNNADTISVRQTGDQISVFGSSQAVKINNGATQISASTVTQITIRGLNGNDTINLSGTGATGIAIKALIDGGAGNDVITGGLGHDSITGGAGNDQIDGGGGSDMLIEVGNVNFTLTNAQLTGNGTDKLTNVEQAQLTGGVSGNKLNAQGFSGSVTLDGASGNDTLLGGSAADVLIGGTGNDGLSGGDGDDRFVFAGSAQLGSDTILAGDNLGTNTLDFSAMGIGVASLDLGMSASQKINSVLKLTLSSNDTIDNVIGSELADKIIGYSTANVLEGRGGNDTLIGGGGDDKLEGGAGLDTLDGFPETISTSMSAIAQAYNDGRLKFLDSKSPLVDFIAESGLGNSVLDLPVVRQSVGEFLQLKGKLQDVFGHALDFSATRDDLASELEKLGFKLEYLETQADKKTGDLLRVTYDRTFDVTQGSFTTSGRTGFDYFDKDVNGVLSGSLSATVPAMRLKVTFGVDLVGDTAAFFVSDSSGFTFEGLSGKAQLKEAELAIGNLANVKAATNLEINLRGELKLHDSDADDKLRLADFGNRSSIRGDVYGAVKLHGDFESNVPILRDKDTKLKWSGDWSATIDKSVLTIHPPTITPPAARDVEQLVRVGINKLLKENNLLGPVGNDFANALNDNIDVLKTSIADTLGISGTFDGMKVDVVKIDETTVRKLINGERVDLVSFALEYDSEAKKPEPKKIPLGAIPLPPPLSFLQVSFKATLEAGIGWDYYVGMGIDTTGVYIDPRTHIGIDGYVQAGVEGSVTAFGLVGIRLEAGAGANLAARLGLFDPNPSDGRIYLDEIFGPGSTIVSAVTNSLQFDLNLSAYAYAKGTLVLPWPLPDITLFDERVTLSSSVVTHHEPTDTNNYRVIQLPGRETTPAPAVLTNGVLSLNGTSDRDYVTLSEQDGRVQIRWAGYQSVEFDRSRVSKVIFKGGDGDDQLVTETGFTIPIDGDGGKGSDILVGGTGNDTLKGGDGNDQLLGLGGKDVVSGEAGNDELDGGEGDDVLTGGIGRDRVRGGGGDDRLDGNAGRDVLEGGDGNDVINGGADNDLIFGGSGKDALDGGDGDDAVNGDDGNDELWGGLGKDSLNGGFDDDTAHGGGGDDLLIGDMGRDTLQGDDGGDTLLGGTGSDVLQGGTGNDCLRGNEGDDSLNGGDQNDTLFGGDDNDTLRAGLGDDFLNGERGVDDINGEAGEDNLIMDLTTSPDSVTDILRGGKDEDTLMISPAYPIDRLNALLQDPKNQDAAFLLTGDNRLTLTQTSSNDFLVQQFDPAANQLVATLNFTLSGGTDTDLENIAIAGMDGNDTIDVSQTTFVSANPKLKREIILDGGDGHDTLIGGNGRDVIRGGAGNDFLIGNANDDELHGDDGNDTLEAGAGNDRNYGDEGDDSLDGGSGFDVQFGGSGRDLLKAGEGLQGDQMYGGDDNDTILGGDGIDVANGQGGHDEIHGGGMSDVLIGGDNDDTIFGDQGRDLLFGEDGQDVLWASDGSPEANVVDPNWIVTYSQLHAREGTLLSVITQLEATLRETDPQSSKYMELNQQLTDAADELVTINDAQDSLNPYQKIKLDRIDGGDGDDELHGSYLSDFLFGAGGDDRIYHTTGDDVVVGGAGRNDAYLLEGTNLDDQIAITGVKDVAGNLEFDVNLVTNLVPMTSHIRLATDLETIGVRGLGGNDTMTANLGSNARTKVRYEGGDGNDVIDVGTIQSSATLIGDSGNDTLIGGASNDSIVGGDGNDTLVGGAGNDTLQGEAGNDYLSELNPSDSGDDSMDGGDGNDTINGGKGSDTLLGGAGNDVISGDEKSPDVGSNDTILGELGNDTLYGNGGNDNLDGGDGDDSIFGHLGNDSLWGQQGNDTLFGDRSDNTGDGRDTLEGGIGDDFQAGGGGDDLINGGDGNDTLIGNLGVDALHGLAGNDVMWGDERESVGSTGAADSLYGGIGDDTLYGGGGNDTLMGSFGNDSLWGGMGLDTLRGEDGNDTIRGDSGVDAVGDADTIDGGLGDDWIRGDGGNDSITSGSGLDTLNGGAGIDSMSVNPDAGDYLPGFESGDQLTFTQSNSEIVKWVVWSNGTLVTLRRDNTVYRHGELAATGVKDIAVTTSGILYYLRTSGELVRFLPDGTSATVAVSVKKLVVDGNSAYYLKPDNTVWMKTDTASAVQIRSATSTYDGVSDFQVVTESSGRKVFYEVCGNGNLYRFTINGDWSKVGQSVNRTDGYNLGAGRARMVDVVTKPTSYQIRVLRSDNVVSRAGAKADGTVIQSVDISFVNIRDFKTLADSTIMFLKTDGSVVIYDQGGGAGRTLRGALGGSAASISFNHNGQSWFVRDSSGNIIVGTDGSTYIDRY